VFTKEHGAPTMFAEIAMRRALNADGNLQLEGRPSPDDSGIPLPRVDEGRDGGAGGTLASQKRAPKRTSPNFA
jgi:hypothetical protein